MHSIIVAVIVVSFVFALYAAFRQSFQLRYIQNYRFHPAIKQKLRKKHPGLTDQQLDWVFEGLRDYFYICNRARRRMVSMPSQVVDDAWHEFILFTRSYQGFCQKGFGRFLHHTPAEAIRSPTMAQDGIKRAWRLACGKAKINPKTPSELPLLFALDAQLKIAGGFVYSLHCVPGSEEYCAGNIGCGGGCSSGCGGGDSCSSDGGGCGGD